MSVTYAPAAAARPYAIPQAPMNLDRAVGQHQALVARVRHLRQLAVKTEELKTLQRLQAKVSAEYQKRPELERVSAELGAKHFTRDVEKVSFDTPPRAERVVLILSGSPSSELLRRTPASYASTLRLKYELLALEILLRKTEEKRASLQALACELPQPEDPTSFMQNAAATSAQALIEGVLKGILNNTPIVVCEATASTLEGPYPFFPFKMLGDSPLSEKRALSSQELAQAPIPTCLDFQRVAEEAFFPLSPHIQAVQGRLRGHSWYAIRLAPSIELVAQAPDASPPLTMTPKTPDNPFLPKADRMPKPASPKIISEPYCLLFEKIDFVRGGYGAKVWYYWFSEQKGPIPEPILDEEGACRLEELKAILSPYFQG